MKALKQPQRRCGCFASLDWQMKLIEVCLQQRVSSLLLLSHQGQLTSSRPSLMRNAIMEFASPLPQRLWSKYQLAYAVSGRNGVRDGIRACHSVGSFIEIVCVRAQASRRSCSSHIILRGPLERRRTEYVGLTFMRAPSSLPLTSKM